MGRPKKWTVERKAGLEAMHNAGMRWKDIAVVLGCSESTAANVYYKEHEPKDKYAEVYDQVYGLTEREANAIKAAAKDGASVQRIATWFGISIVAVKQLIKPIATKEEFIAEWNAARMQLLKGTQDGNQQARRF